MTTLRITKRTVDTLQSSCNEFTVWDNAVTGFGVRVRPTGAKSYVVLYRAGAGRGAPVRRYTIAAVGKITPECARTRAKIILGAVAHGHDPANQKTDERERQRARCNAVQGRDIEVTDAGIRVLGKPNGNGQDD